MKKINMMLLTLGVAALTFTGCKEEDPFYTAGPDDFPRILNTDLPEWQKGEPGTLNEIPRDRNFQYDVIITPKDYTTVKWNIDGVIEHVGPSIDKPLLAGKHLVTIIAETEAGKSSSRTFYEVVTPLAEDPTLDASPKARWLKPGTNVSISGANLDGITGAYLTPVYTIDNLNDKPATEHNYTTLDNVTVVDGNLTFGVPADIAEGSYTIIVDNGEMKYACDNVTVSNSKYVEPGLTEKVLWSGDNALNWDAENIKITADQLADVPVGEAITITYTKMAEAELAEVYWALRITTPWWGDNPAVDDILAQTDFGPIEEDTYTIIYDERVKALVEERGAMCLVGNGLKITKIHYMGVGKAQVALWSGNNALNWDAENIKVTADMLAALSVGDDIYIEYAKMPEAELAEIYWALRITTPWWGDNPAADDILPQTDFGPIEDGAPIIIKYDERVKALVEERGAMCLVGNGLKITKIYYMGVPPAETTIWEGSCQINWGESNVALNCAELGIEVGKEVVVYYALCDMPEGYHAARLATGPSWIGDVLPQFDLDASVAEGSFSVKITNEIMDAINADGGQILVVGYGYNATKVTIK